MAPSSNPLPVIATFAGIRIPVFKGIRISVVGRDFSRQYERHFVGSTLLSIDIVAVTSCAFVLTIGGTLPLHVNTLTPDTDYMVSIRVVDGDVVKASDWRVVHTLPQVGYLPKAMPKTVLRQQLGDSTVRMVRSMHPCPTF